MKTAVSIPDPIFTAADRLARRLGISRSELYARALERELSDESDEAITAQLDSLFVDLDSTVDPLVASAQRRVVASEE